jgi:hypothetical protein
MSAKSKIDFSDLSEVDAVRLVANSAVVARESGHNVVVKTASISGKKGILIFMPGYVYDGSDIVANKEELPLVAEEATP